MTFKLSLEERQRRAEENRRRYWSSAVDRLNRINKMRARRGRPIIVSLDEIETRGRAF